MIDPKTYVEQIGEVLQAHSIFLHMEEVNPEVDDLLDHAIGHLNLFIDSLPKEIVEGAKAHVLETGCTLR